MADGGYRWWYIDAQSDDGQHALTLIAFVGSVFSPYYAWQRRRRGTVAAAGHCAVNAVFYGPGRRKRWAMTERGAGALQREGHGLRIGPSALRREGDSLVIDLREYCTPLPRPLRGQVRLQLPGARLGDNAYALDRAGRHFWQPLAPVARVAVALAQPALAWCGSAYWDCNWGDEPLERGFRHWHWSRAHRADGSCAVLYQLCDAAGETRELALALDPQGAVRELALPPQHPLPASRVWRIGRATRATAGRAGVIRTLEDTPFYCRSLLQTSLEGECLTAIHESLDLARFATPWVQALLPFRMPRRAG